MAGPGPAAALQGLLGNLARWATIVGVGASLAQTSMYNGALAAWRARSTAAAQRAALTRGAANPNQLTAASKLSCLTA